MLEAQKGKKGGLILYISMELSQDKFEVQK
jgi:hypothetical protein